MLDNMARKLQILLSQLSRQPNVDLETRKTLEDLSAFITTASQMAREKGIAERLKAISEESQKSLESISRAGIPASTKEATERSLEIVNTWRPIFQLLIRQREFRKLMVNSLRIIRRLFLRYGEDVMENASQKFVEGESVSSIYESTKEQIREKSEERQMTDEEWKTIEKEITQVFAILSREPTYREGLDRLFRLFDLFRSSAKTLTDQLPSAEPHARRAQFETEELVSVFAKRETLDKFKIDLRNLIAKFEDNAELKNYFTEVREFILSTKSEEFVHSEEFKAKSKELYYRGRYRMQQLKDEPALNSFLNTTDELLDNIKNDEFVKILRHQAGILTSDLSYVDMEGNTRIDTDMLSKLQSVVGPVLAETLKYIPLPRIETSDSYRDFWLDNIILCGYDILPENIRIHTETDSELSLREGETKSMNIRLVIVLDKLRTELKDMSFYYKKKSFPEVSDKGRVTLRFGGEGANLRFTFNVVQDELSRTSKITEGCVNFQIVNMDIDFDYSTITHTTLLPFMTSWYKQQIAYEIETAVEKNLTSIVQDIGQRLSEALTEVNRPLQTGIEMARKAFKSTDIAQIYEKRREKLE
jgi:hypothetical protein